MWDDYGQCQPKFVVWITVDSKMVQTKKTWQELRRHPVECLLALTSNCSAHIRVALWKAAEALKSLSAATHPAHISAIFVVVASSCFLAGCDHWTLKCAAARKPDKEWRQIPVWKWICRLRSFICNELVWNPLLSSLSLSPCGIFPHLESHHPAE